MLIFGMLAAISAGAEIVVSGTVSTAEGGVASGARVELLPAFDSFASGKLILAGRLEPEAAAHTASGSDGQFHLEVPEAGMWKVVVRADGFIAMQFPPVLFLASRELGPVTLHRDHTTSLRALDPAGNPLGNAWVWAAGGSPPDPTTGWRTDYRALRSGADGRFVVPKRASEQLDYTVLADGYPPSEPSSASDVRLEPSSFPRSIRVVDESGRGVADVLLRIGELSWPLGLTGTSGDIAVPVRPDRATKVVLTTADGRQQNGEVSSGDELVTMHLEAAMPIIGRVLDAADRRPLVGVFLWSGSDLGRLTRTDAEGRYRVVAPDPSGFWIQAESAGFVPRSIYVTSEQIAAGRAPSVALIRETALVGAVTDLDGALVKDARVEAFRTRRDGGRGFFHPDPADSRSTSDSQGKFRLAGLTPGKHYELRASREGFMPAMAGTSAAKDPVPRPGIRLILTPIRGAFGRIVDQQERPVEGAEVRLTHAGRSRAGARVPAAVDGEEADPFVGRSDEQGRFEIPEIPARAIDLNVLKKGFAPTRIRGIRVPAGSENLDLGTVVLIPGAQLVGYVVDAQGDGLAGASVHVLTERGSPRRLGSIIAQQIAAAPPDAQTDVRGLFVIDDLAMGRRVHLFVHRPGYASAWLEHVEVPLLETPSITLEPGFGVTGRVVDEARQPVAGAQVVAEWRQIIDETDIPVGSAEQRRTQTDTDGAFTISDLEAGAATLQVMAEGFVPPAPIDLVLGAESEEPYLITLERGAVLTGRIADSDEKAVVGARVGTGEVAAFSDAEGIYRLEGMALGAAKVETFHPHYELVTSEIDVEPGINELDVTFRNGHEVRGRVVDPGDRTLAEAFIELIYEGRPAPRKYRAMTLDDGSFLLPSVVDGEYVVTAGKAGYATAEMPWKLRVDGTPVETADVVLEQAAAIVGQVLGLDFDQLAQVEVWAEDGRGRPHPGIVNYQGRYEIRGLASGEWLVRAVLAGGRRQTQTRLTITAGAGEVRRDLEFEEGLSLSGRVVYHGAPLPGALVSLRGYQVAVKRTVRTDRHGRFRIEDLVEGNYRLGLLHERELAVHNQDVELTASQELVLDVSSARIIGTVRREVDGEPVERALVIIRRIAASPGEENMLTAGSGPDGSFTFPRVPKGEYRLTVRKDGFTSEERLVELTTASEERRLEILLTATEGLALTVRDHSGRPPAFVTAAVLDTDGRPFLVESRPVDADGAVWLASVPAGRWQLLVAAPGAAQAQLAIEVPGAPVPLVLKAAGRLAIRIPDLVNSDLIATLSLFDADGRPYRGLDSAQGLQDSWQLVAGKGTVAQLPPGAWLVRAIAGDGRLYSGSAVVRAGAETELVLE